MRLIRALSPRLYEEALKVPRGMTLFMHEYFDRKPVEGIEVGVDEGIHAQSLFRWLNIKRLFAVDFYKPYVEDNRIIDNSRHWKEAYTRLKPYRNRIVFLKTDSVKAAGLIPYQVDFAYIDGAHDYENVKRDIKAFYPLVREKGVLGGHDYFFPGVKKAVKELVEEKKMKLYTGSYSDWWIIKQKEVL